MRAFVFLLAAVSCASAFADEGALTLKPGPGMALVANHCSACHSLDYPLMNSGFLDAKGWDAEVAKMIKTYGAEIDEATAAKIKAYLTANYGK